MASSSRVVWWGRPRRRSAQLAHANRAVWYRSSKYLTEFFEDIETDYAHDGSTRQRWVADVLSKILNEPQPAANVPSDTFARVIARLMDQEDARNEDPPRAGALAMLNASLAREGYEAFYREDKR
jgi:hypothetical protein